VTASSQRGPDDSAASRASRRALAKLLALAYSGERAAAFAYRGHWRSSSDPEERAAIKEIEEDEWRHRSELGDMLVVLGARPGFLRELVFLVIGKVLGASCLLAGWFLPMLGAGWLESRNVREYEVAARQAARSGFREWVDPLLTMAEVEWDHEEYFRKKVLSRRLGRRLRLWKPPPPRAHIRESFRLWEQDRTVDGDQVFETRPSS